MVYTLFNDTLNVVNLIESSEKVKLTKVMKGVTDMKQEHNKERL